MTNLKEVNFGMNKFCGPAVLSALTGKSTDECAAVISAINGQTTITAVYMHDLMRAFNKLGFDFTKEEKLIGRTLYGTLFRLASEEGMYIVCVPHHVVAVEVKDKRAYIIDNHTKQPLVASSSSRLMQKVTEVYRVKERPKPIKLPPSWQDRERYDKVMRMIEEAKRILSVVEVHVNAIDDEELRIHAKAEASKI